MRDVITIDGPSGSGKSTASKRLAEKLGYKYLDTGALYRAVAWYATDRGIDPEDLKELTGMLEKITITFEGDRVSVNGTDITSQIRSPEIGELSSRVSAKPAVREYLFSMQREIGLRGKVVIEGRDIGTAVFPESENKFYLDAGPEKRAGRRYKELQEKGVNTTLENILKSIIKRDDRDSNRENAPLTRTDSMVYIDTSNISAEEVVNKIMEALKTS